MSQTVCNLRTNVRTHVADLDAVSSYPSDSVVANLSKATTKRELIDVEGIDKETFKHNNINLLFGPINSGIYCQEMLNAPSYDELLEEIKKKVSV